MGLLDLRDELNVARQFVATLWLAAQAPGVPAEVRAALCAVANAAREKLEDVGAALDAVITGTVAQP